jgi:predicted O-methyltransferase YrrM
VLAIGATEINGTSPAEQALAVDGMLIVMESDVTLAQQARQRFSSAGLGGRATVITGDPRRMLHKLAGPFDVIFCGSAEPSVRDKLAALLAPDGVLITNNDE